VTRYSDPRLKEQVAPQTDEDEFWIGEVLDYKNLGNEDKKTPEKNSRLLMSLEQVTRPTTLHAI